MKLLESNTLTKSNLYGRTLVLLTITIITILISTEFEFLTENSVRFGQFVGVFSLLLVTVIYYNFWRLSGVLECSKLVQKLLLLYLLTWSPIFGSILPTIWTEMNSQSYKLIFSLNMLVNSSYYVLIIWIVMRDIFQAKTTKGDHLWGAVVTYILIIVIFANMMRLITIWYPDAIGEFYSNGLEYFYNCLVISLNAASGRDNIIPTHQFLDKVAMFENWFLNLFLIVILGRLLSVPLEKKTTI